MRSARMLLATATATAALAITAPAAYAQAMGDWDHDNNSYSKEHHKDGKHDKPHGGMHTGGGALSAVTADDEWDGDKGDHEGKEEEHGKEKEHDKGSWKDKHHKPHGGMHTGGGALSAVNSDDDWDNPKHDPDTYKEDDDWGGKHDGHDKGSWEGKHDKPRGGMHTGGGGLASAPGVTAGGMAVLAVAGTGLYALRRQRASRGTV
ncbi:hypothetical protein [Streptomyces iakyrus]|uniref:hypothetical protein n=1 Tax=Streptomyces iakyrus TaxID=68219 RepID=UPI000524C379|nr:hypothetical protein [Streptomyces iakyrus]